MVCDLCGSKEHAVIFPGKDRMHGVKGKFWIVRCKRCGLEWCSPKMTLKQLSAYYPESGYYSFTPPDENAFMFRLEHEVFRTSYVPQWSLKRLLVLPAKPLFRGTKIIKGGKILDIGCGSGTFLLHMKRLGMRPYGIEPGRFNEQYAEAHKLNIKRGSLREGHFKDDFFDVITINHVFEHVVDPTATLREIHRILKPGGTLIIGIPQTHSLAAKMYGRYWVGLDVPRHRFHYSVGNIKQYAQKTGFDVVSVRYNSLPLQFTASSLYVMNGLRKRQVLLQDNHQSKLMFLALLPLVEACNLLRIGDQAEIVLRK